MFELLVEAGIRVPEPVRISTSDTAKFLGQVDRIGTVAASKQADLLVIDGNPAASGGGRPLITPPLDARAGRHPSVARGIGARHLADYQKASSLPPV